MKKLILLTLITPLLFLASCSSGNDIIGKWSFTDVEFPAGRPAEVTDDQLAEMKEMLKEMKYEFVDAKNFKITGSAMTDETIKGTYTLSGEELTMKYEAGKEQKFHVNELSSNKLVMEMKNESKKGERIAFVMTK